MRERPFRFVGGDCVLDFLNTAGGDTKARDVERLNSYDDALTWALAAEVINDRECEELRIVAAGSPETAGRGLDELRIQRECLYNFLIASLEGRSLPVADRINIEAGVNSAF